MNRLTGLLFVTLAVVGFTGTSHAEELNPSGKWKWSNTNQKNQTQDATLQLKFEGEKLTGSVPGPKKSQIEIENASFKDGQISFTVTRERNSQKVTQKFSGKLEGDTITGSIENAKGKSRDWTAKREKS